MNSIHWKYAVKYNSFWVAQDDEGKLLLTQNEVDAETRWDIRGAIALRNRYIKEQRNVTMGNKPDLVIEYTHRPQRINTEWGRM